MSYKFVIQNFTRSLKMQISHLDQITAQKLDIDLMGKYGFELSQLMELAGLSCAVGVQRCFKLKNYKNVAIICGPGNNGGDGLVCARHLKHFGYSPTVYLPKQPREPFIQKLETQCQLNEIVMIKSFDVELNKFDLIVDALFGFSFKPPIREEFIGLMNKLYTTDRPIVSIDIPSGWDVNQGPPLANGQDYIKPAMLISLTAPKIGCANFKGIHLLGGRFVPLQMMREYNLILPEFKESDQVVEIN